MSELEERVRRRVAEIPEGRVVTYGDVAHAVGTSARAVGRILNRAGRGIPWWRVVAADGRPFSGARDRARARYVEEQTPLADDGEDLRVDLARAAWIWSG